MTLLLVALLAVADAPCPAVERLAPAGRLFRSGDLIRAHELIDSLRQSYPNCPELVLQAARVTAARDMPALARDLLARYISLAPESARGYEALGDFLSTQGDLAGAEQAFRKALSLRPGSVAALLGAGSVLSRQGREHDAEARQFMEKACRLAPKLPQAFFQLGDFLASRGNYSEAAAAFRRVVALDPSDAVAWRYLATALEFAGDPEAAEPAYKQGLKVNGALLDPLLPYYYGKFLLQRNRLAESRSYLDEAAKLAPGFGAVFYERAKLHLQMEDFAAARADAERLLAVPASERQVYDFQLYNLLATIYARIGEKELAGRYASLARAAQRAYEISRRSGDRRQAGR